MRSTDPGAKSYHATYYRANKHKWNTPEAKARRRKWQREAYRKNPEARLVRLAANTYGVSIEEARRLRSISACEACGADLDLSVGQGKKSRAIDHDHATGRVRGVLCQRCNLTLGLVEDSTELLDALLVYLRRR